MGRKDAPAWTLQIVLDMEVSAERWNEALSVLETETLVLRVLCRQLFLRRETQMACCVCTNTHV
jgi:hypothetical protein